MSTYQTYCTYSIHSVYVSIPDILYCTYSVYTYVIIPGMLYSVHCTHCTIYISVYQTSVKSANQTYCTPYEHLQCTVNVSRHDILYTHCTLYSVHVSILDTQYSVHVSISFISIVQRSNLCRAHLRVRIVELPVRNSALNCFRPKTYSLLRVQYIMGQW